MKVTITAVGQLKEGPIREICNDYSKRLHWQLSIEELDPRKFKDINAELINRIDSGSFLIVLDERGKDFTSPQFAEKIQDIQLNQYSSLQFIIGAADGLSKDVRSKANMLLSFGKLTWPHMMARAMLIEQLYRAQQIIAGHPYHK